MDAALIASIAVAVFLVIFIVIGFYRGFLRVVLSILSIVLTIILTGVFAGPLADYAENSTAIGERLRQRIEEYVNDKMSAMVGNVEEIEDQFIDSLPVTESMKTQLRDNYSAAYRINGETVSFARSIASVLTTMIIKLLSYVILFIVISLILRLILRLSNLINHIPVIGGINRIAGALFGFAEGVIFLWTICMIIMILSGTDFGAACEKVIDSSKFLTFIYEHNYLMNIINSATGLFTITERFL